MSNVASEAWFQDAGLRIVLTVLNADGGEARIVGGAVRNSLMGLPVSDMDIATTLKPEEVQARAAAAGIKCVPTGIKHGTVTLVVDGRPFEVTTLRRDVETFGRHAEVVFTDDWKVDAERRDLTINALYADAAGAVHDYVGGLGDLQTATIRFIGDPGQRIAEDYLRILRFFRFFAHYGRGRPDAAGLKACAAAKANLDKLSAERVWSELKKLLSAEDPFRALLWMRTAGVLTQVLPESEKWGIDAIPALVAAERRHRWPVDPLLRLAAIVPPDTERLAGMASRLRLSGAERAYLTEFSEFPAMTTAIGQGAFSALLYDLGKTGAIVRSRLAIAQLGENEEHDMTVMARLAELQTLLGMAEDWVKPELPVKGADLIAAGLPAGPEIGKAIARLERRWKDSGFRLTRDALLAELGSS